MTAFKADGEFGTSISTLSDAGEVQSGAVPDEQDDGELDESLPNGESLIAAAVALATGSAVSHPDGRADESTLADAALADAQLVQRYWRFAPDEELVGLTPARLLEAARAHRDLAAARRPGELKLRITLSPDREHTVIELVTDDMPFLVDSITGVLSARNLDVQLLVHPVMVVRRDDDGTLTEVCAEVEADDAIVDDVIESWMRVEVDPIRDETEAEQVRLDLDRVLGDVRKAVEDWPAIRSRALSLADEIAQATLPVPERDITDSVELLRWLAGQHFTFLGYREYTLTHEDDRELLAAVPGTGLGILRGEDSEPMVLSSMTPEAHRKALEKRLLIITKANSRSTVHRNAFLDYIGFKSFDAQGNVVGERRFLGLFSSAAYRTSVRDLPVVRRKVASVLDRSGLSPRSHSGKDLLEILETYPRDELFQISTDDLYQSVIGVLRMAGRRQLRVFLRRDGYGRFISCLIYLPRDRFTTAHRLSMQDVLLRELNGIGVDYTTRVTESNLARVHFIVRTDPANPPVEVDADALAELLSDATRNWDDDFRLVLERKVGDAAAKVLNARYADALPETYKDGHNPYEAVQDLAKLELLDESGQLEMHLFRRRKNSDDVRFKVFRYGESMVLSAVLPVLHSLGVQVTDERPYEITRDDGSIFVYDFGLRLPAGARELTEVRAHVENAFGAAWRGEAEVDGFNELVLRSGLTWRQVVVLRAYAKYLRQAGTVFSQESMESTFIAYPQIASLLVALFEIRFDPVRQLTDAERGTQAKELVSAVGRQLDGVDSLDQDRILRNFLTLIQATLRTSFFQRSAKGDEASRPKSYVAFKLDPQAIPDLPAPRPKYEIFVYSPRFEGVHLRFGAVARGGLRWSDRRDDFRTEILGLVKAQMVKNSVIVPVGAKGGFVLKQAPASGRSAAGASPRATQEELLAEGIACYRRFISALLDVTDNLDAGKIVPPRDVVRHDGDDPYLVVAADKGTATFSDIANELSLSYGFWLGDAFASGGSAGYDHKKMGITARGAWESVKRHFRDLNIDIQAQDFTVVGVGDMSGDVFGNGMLLSEHIRLVAAFDHRHIFIDPDPDAASSFAERRRMFDLPRSSWADYETKLISEGGGVFPRTAKSIPITPQIRAALGLDTSVTAMSPAELMKAILLAPVDLLWNGGIGTYVKAITESHGEVGDKTNDMIRVNGVHLRCRVVGEGGNLGLTQAGRIEYARRGAAGAGGRVYTDFIDNSAGVDCSDHEVNIKILLGSDLAVDRRNELLASMTDEVAALVLRDNYGQATALGNSVDQARSLLPVHRRLLSALERSGRLNRALESLPDDEELASRGAAGGGLCAPEFAVLMAYVKIILEDEIVDSDLPDEPWTNQTLVDYFPTQLHGMDQQMTTHRLRREIVTTALVNETVNRGGITFVHRAVEETGFTAADVLRAYVVVRDVFDLPALWAAIEATDNRVPTAVQTSMYLQLRRLMDRAVRWLLQNRRLPLDVSAEIARLRPGVAQLLPRMELLSRGAERNAMRANATALVDVGVPAALADSETRALYGFGLLDVVEVALAGQREFTEVGEVYFALSERFRIDELLTKISALPRDDRWQTLARMALRYDLYAALAALTSEVLASTPATADVSQRVITWERQNTTAITRTRDAIVEFDGSRADLAALSVLLRQIRTLVRTAAA